MQQIQLEQIIYAVVEPAPFNRTFNFPFIWPDIFQWLYQ